MRNFLNFAAPAILIVTLSSPTQAQEPTNPVGFTLSCTIPAGQGTCFAEVSIPDGQRLVLEHVSAKVFTPSGLTVQLFISMSTFTLPIGTLNARHYIVLTPTKSDAVYYASQPIRMYSLAGSHVQINGQRITWGAPGPISYEVHLSGYLLP